MTTAPSVPPSRGIESIAHHFLSQMSSPPRRVGPSRLAEAPPDFSLPENTVSAPASRPDVDSTSEAVEMFPRPKSVDSPSSAALIVLLTDNAERNNVVIDQYARQIAWQNGPIGLLRVTQTQLELNEYIPFAADNAQAAPGESGGCSPDISVDKAELSALFGNGRTIDEDSKSNVPMPLRQAFEYLSSRVETILIHCDDPDRELLRPYLRGGDSAVVFASSSRDGLVGAYQNIKWLAKDAGFNREISLFVSDANEQTVDAVFDKLGRTAQQFLDVEILYADYPQSGGNMNRRLLAASPLNPSIQHELCRWFGGGRENLESNIPGEAKPQDQYELENNPQDKPEVFQTLPKNIQLPKTQDFMPGITEEKPRITPVDHTDAPIYCPIPVSEFPTDEDPLCDVLVKSFPAWLGDIPSALSLPTQPTDGFDPAVRLLVDARGRAYVLAPCLSAGGITTRICNARHQLANRIKDIADRYPQLKIDYSLFPEVILVAPENMSKFLSAEEANFDFPLHLKRLFFLDDSRQKSLLIV
jgi:hypothetical protein